MIEPTPNPMGDPDEFDDRDVRVFGVWGWYDYSVKIPMDELGYQKVMVSNVKSGLEPTPMGKTTPCKPRCKRSDRPPTTSQACPKPRLSNQVGSRRDELAVQIRNAKGSEEGLVSVEFNYTRIGTNCAQANRWSLEIDGWPPACLPLDKGNGRGAATLCNFVEGVPQESRRIKKFPVPNKWNRMVQWLFILCSPYAVVAGLQLTGGLGKSTAWMMTNLYHPQGSWEAAEISDIDMSRWMSKSVAKIVMPTAER